MQQSDVKWLHLSDFHVGKDGYAQNRIHEYILGEVDAYIKKSFKPDFVFITGDIANSGKAEEYKLFESEFLIPLIQKLGDEYLKKIFIIPGNHDVDRREGKAVMRYGVLDEIPDFLDPTPEGCNAREPLLTRFKAFDNYSWYLERDKWVTQTSGKAACRHTINGLEVGVLCLNTAWLCGGKEDMRKLSPGIGMVEMGLKELEGCAPIFVLGHHPLDWLLPSDEAQMYALLGKYGALYLHGHLHKSRHQSVVIGTQSVITIQSGCAFNARNDEQWLPKLLWAGFDSENNAVLIQPKKWIHDHREWALDSDAIKNSLRVEGRDYWVIDAHYSKAVLGGGESTKPKVDEESVSAPEGWAILDERFFAERSTPVSDERLLMYYEGRVPMWEDIIAKKIPERTIVPDLIATIGEAIDSKEVSFTLLLGAGGEGKSTAFLQTIERITRTQKVKILWRSNPEKPIPAEFVSRLAKSSEVWLIATDEGDSLVTDLYESIRAIRRDANIHFFVACRDTDWIEHNGNDFAWGQFAKFTERRMKGLDDHDARVIVEAWSKLGEKGLGKLSGLDPEVAITRLLDAARLEASSSDGAFLGAMLRVRVGLALKDHVAALMGRLETREIAGLPGKSLLDAFAYIAVPHAYNLLFLTKPVLARALGIEETRLRRRVIGPLGDEAAATSSGQYILTRHRAIAEAAMSIAVNRFEFDPEDILCDLVRAALTANAEAALVPNLTDWRYLSTKMFEAGNQTLGVKLALTAVSVDPGNTFLAVKLAQLYREAGQAEQSVQVFRKTYISSKGNRAYFTEWATCEGFVNNRALSVWLNAFSIADGAERRPPDARDVGFGLAGCLINFIALYERYEHDLYLQAAVAADQLARRITLPKSAFNVFEEQKEHLQTLGGNFSVNPELLLKHFTSGIERAYSQREEDLTSAIQPPSGMSFDGLKDIVRLK